MLMTKWFSKLFGTRDETADSIPLRVLNLTRGTVVVAELDVANHGASRRKGLLGRKHFSEGEGLWIRPCEAVHTFFMNFPIDLVYLDRSYRVLKVRSGVPAWRISACLRATSVIEVPAGTIRVTQTQRGDRLEFSVGHAGEPAAAKRPFPCALPTVDSSYLSDNRQNTLGS